jgi:UDP-N-acetylmuramoyl-tripeptide--D-alanyl-D-alanine ligase
MMPATMAMRYRLRDIPAMLRTPGGRRQVVDGANYRLWPAWSRLAALHRRTLARDTHVVAVTGTFGKSTTVRAVAAALGAPFGHTSMMNAWTSIARSVLRIRPGQPHAVIEVGISGPGELARYGRMVRPDVAIVTSIGSEHHEKLPTLEDKRGEKVLLVRALGPSGVAVLNGDDPHTRWMASSAPGRVVTYGTGERCDVRASDVRLDWPRGTRFRLSAFGDERDVAIRLIGRQMIYPVLAAVAVSQVEGVRLDDALARLEALSPTPGRMEPVALPNGAILLRDDYKMTVETIHAALDVLDEIPAERKVVFFGDMSAMQGREWPIYVSVGMHVARVASRFWLTGRSSKRYAAGARKAGMPREAIVDTGRTVQEAAARLRAMLRPGDVVLMKGRRGQKLDRVRLMLEGREVGCSIKLCEIRTMECVDCPMLERGWGDHPVFAPGWIVPRADRPKPGKAKARRGL